MRHQLVVGLLEIFGNDAGLAHDGNEIGVAFPAWNDMQVKMSGDACSRASSDVQSDVQPIRVVYLPENLLAFLRLEDELGQFFAGSLHQGGDMPVRDNHQVSGRVGKPVEYYKGVLASAQDQIGAVILFGEETAQNTAVFIFTCGGKILEAPGRPYMFHLGIQ